MGPIPLISNPPPSMTTEDEGFIFTQSSERSPNFSDTNGGSFMIYSAQRFGIKSEFLRGSSHSVRSADGVFHAPLRGSRIKRGYR